MSYAININGELEKDFGGKKKPNLNAQDSAFDFKTLYNKAREEDPSFLSLKKKVSAFIWKELLM